MKLYRITRKLELEGSIVVSVPDDITDEQLDEIISEETTDLSGLLDRKADCYNATEIFRAHDVVLIEAGAPDAVEAIPHEEFADDLEWVKTEPV